MKRIFARGLLFLVIITSGELAVAGQEGEGYQKTVAEARNEIREGEKSAVYVRNYCGVPQRSEDLGRELLCGTKAKIAVNRDYCENVLGKSTYTQRVTARMGGELAERYPGSNMNCQSSSGVFRGPGGYDYHLVDGLLNRTVIPPDGGLTWEANMFRKAQKVVAVVYTGTDTSGNYIRMIVDINNPGESQFIDARLPISLQSGKVATGDKSLNIQGNELIWALNEVYRTVAAPGGDAMYQMANSLILNPDYREWFLNQAVELLKNQGGQK